MNNRIRLLPVGIKPGVILSAGLLLPLSGSHAKSLNGVISFEKERPAGMISGGMVNFLMSLG